MPRFTLALMFLSPFAYADITRLQETLPGVAGIPSNRGYIIDDSILGFKQVTPTTNGVVDTSRPGYLIGPNHGAGRNREMVDTIRVQETLPGVAGIPSNRGYIVDGSLPGFKRVTPTTNGVVDTSHPGYLIGPTLGTDTSLNMDDSPRSRRSVLDE